MFLYCGGHHDSDRTTVLVWSPRLKLLYCKYHQFMYTLPNKDFLPSFLPSITTTGVGDGAISHDRARTSSCHPQVWATEQCRTTEPVPLHAIHRCGRWGNVARQSPYLSITTTSVGNGSLSHDRAHTSPCLPQVWAMEQCHTTEPIPLHANHRCERSSNFARQSP